MSDHEINQGNELRAFMEQQENKTQLLLQTLQNINNTINTLKPNQTNGRDC